MGGHGVNLNQLHYHNLASFECVVLVGQVRPKFSCYINLSVYICICISIFDPSSTYLFVYPQLRICLYKGIAKENLRGGVESPKFENQEGVQGVNGLERGLGNNLRKFFDLNVILFVFTSIFFNICNSKSFFIIFLLFSYLFHQFWVFTAHPSQGLYAGGEGVAALPARLHYCVCISLDLSIHPSIYLLSI